MKIQLNFHQHLSNFNNFLHNQANKVFLHLNNQVLKQYKNLAFYKKQIFQSSPKESQNESDSEHSIDFTVEESEVSIPTSETKVHFSDKITFVDELPTAVEPPLQAPIIESNTKKITQQEKESSLEASLLIQQEVAKELNKVPTLCNCISNKKQLINEIVTKVSNRVISDFSDTHNIDKSQRKRKISLKTFIADEWENFQISHLKTLGVNKTNFNST